MSIEHVLTESSNNSLHKSFKRKKRIYSIIPYHPTRERDLFTFLSIEVLSHIGKALRVACETSMSFPFKSFTPVFQKIICR